DPEVDDPPAPVLHDGEVAARGEEEAGAVHEADGDGAGDEQPDDVGGLAHTAPGRPERADHQHEPEEQAAEEGDLKGAAEFDVFVALVPEPEAGVEAEALLDARPLTREAADDDHDQGAEQGEDTGALVTRFVPADERR